MELNPLDYSLEKETPSNGHSTSFQAFQSHLVRSRLGQVNYLQVKNKITIRNCCLLAGNHCSGSRIIWQIIIFIIFWVPKSVRFRCGIAWYILTEKNSMFFSIIFTMEQFVALNARHFFEDVQGTQISMGPQPTFSHV